MIVVKEIGEDSLRDNTEIRGMIRVNKYLIHGYV